MVFLLFLFINLALFWPMFSGLLPLPLDALAGVYYPWAGEFWGYVAGIPYKNMAVTDVFSQLYPWRALAMDIFRTGELPLWNQFSFSGYPLLANWQSAPFYPLNILMLLFGNLNGFGFMVFLQPLLTMIFMFLFFQQIKVSKIGSIIGSVALALSGFSITYLEYATSGQIFMWLPLALLFLEKYFINYSKKYLAFFALCFFPVLTGGFFQPALYVCLIIVFYLIFRIYTDKEIKNKLKTLGVVLFFTFLGCGTASLQLLPTAELLSLSIRSLDHNIVEYQYGLLPVKNLVTFISPDYFGNPVTQNFWGFMQYQETAGYFSLVVLVLVFSGLLLAQKSWRQKLFFTLFFGSLLLAFDNSVSRLVYQLKLPLISTGYASRWLMVTTFSASVLAALNFDNLQKRLYFLSSLTIFCIVVGSYFVTKNSFLVLSISPEHAAIATRNLLLPILVASSAIFLNFVYNKKWVFQSAIIILIIFDLLRFGIKFTPFSKPEYITRTQPTFEFIKTNIGQNRVSAQSGPILPANTWLYEKLPSPAGYDPLVLKDYGTFFAALNIGTSSAETPGTDIVNNSYTRYLNVVNYNSLLIDLTGTKYFLGLKTKDGKIETYGKYDTGAFTDTRYKKVFEDGKVVVLENKTVMPRVKLYYKAEFAESAEQAANKLAKNHDFYNTLLVNEATPKSFEPDADDYSKIANYRPNSVNVSVSAKNGAYLFLSDVLYPGWKVKLNNQEAKIIKTFGVFRGVEIPPGTTDVVFYYEPLSFWYGFVASIISLLFILIYFKHGS